MKLFDLTQNKIQATAGLPVHVKNPALALLILFGLFFAMLMIVSLVMGLMGDKALTAPGLRIFSVIQDIFVFILPAIVTAMIATRLPATFLRVDAKVNFKTLFFAVLVLICSIPAMDFVVALNEAISLPPALKPLEDAIREMEEAARESLSLIQGGNSVGDLMLSVLIIGVLTGFAEEIFFRGALQRLFRAQKMNPHVAVWLTALIFSLLHFQFYGFIPRMLLGAYFGYVVWWSGSLWTAVLCHAVNNSIVVTAEWFNRGDDLSEIASELGNTIAPTPQEIVTIVLSIAVTCLGLIVLRRNALRSKKLNCTVNTQTINHEN